MKPRNVVDSVTHAYHVHPGALHAADWIRPMTRAEWYGRVLRAILYLAATERVDDYRQMLDYDWVIAERHVRDWNNKWALPKRKVT